MAAEGKFPSNTPEKKTGRKKDKLHEFELAGGVEGGMPAGLASGPHPNASIKARKKPKPKSR